MVDESRQSTMDDGPSGSSSRPGGSYGGGSYGGGGGGSYGGGGPRGGGSGGPRPRRRMGGGRAAPRRKICSFCADNIDYIDYKDANRIRRYLTERAKMEARRKFGTCAKHQRALSTAIKRARHVGLLPYTAHQSRG